MRLLLFSLLVIVQIFKSCEKDDIKNNCKNRFYYYGSEKIFFTEIPNQGSISFYDTISAEIKNQIIEQYPDVDILSVPSNSRHVIISINSRNCIETDLLFATIKNDFRISNCNKDLVSEQGSTCGITDLFVCKLKSSTTLNQLMELIIKNEVEIISTDPTNYHYTIRADKNSMGDALDIANTFFESGYFEFAEPEFFGNYGTYHITNNKE